MAGVEAERTGSVKPGKQPDFANFQRIVDEANKRCGWEPDRYTLTLGQMAAAMLMAEIDNKIMGARMKIEVERDSDGVMAHLVEGGSAYTPLELTDSQKVILGNDLNKRLKAAGLTATGTVKYSYGPAVSEGRTRLRIELSSGNSMVFKMPADKKQIELQARLDNLISEINVAGYRLRYAGGSEVDLVAITE